MSEMTHCWFQVADPGGGAAYRTFTFDSVQQGANYIVTISFDGSGAMPLMLSEAQPTVTLPSSDARVKPTGTLMLAWDAGSPGKAIQFDGTFHTKAPTTVQNVIVASFD